MTQDLASLVGSRICHDLISPIGAISNGVELIGMTQSAGGAEMALINDSVMNASARIRFFRIAFGKASPEQLIGQTEVSQILEATSHGGRINFDWQVVDKQKRTYVRCAFLAIQCLETALPRGGNIIISRTPDGWKLRGVASDLRWDAALWDGLTNQDTRLEHTPAQVQFALMPDALQDANWRIQVDHTSTEITVHLR